jgi:ubiquinone/menaquinone biosynthesis C-methylase UbiE
MNVSAKDYYETIVKNYGDLDDKVVMENVALQQAMIDAVPFPKDAHIKVLDLGTGPGIGAEKILTLWSNSSLVGVDFSDEMTKIAGHMLAKFAGRFQLIQAEIDGLNLSQYGMFNVVISGVTIHNIHHTSKALLFSEIFKCLNDKGVFINGDFIEGETDEENDRMNAEYRAFLEKNLEGEECTTWLKHAFEFDMPMKLSGQIKLLKSAGFQDVKTVWQFSKEAVYTALK